MKISRAMPLAAAVCAVLFAAGAAEAGMSKKSSKAPATAASSTASTTTTPPSSSPGGMGMMGGGPGVHPGAGSFLLDHFDEIDTDKNGQLSRDELKAWLTAKQQEMQQRIADHIKAADTNGDGMISLAEAKAALPMVYDHFDFLDANHDGLISQAEFDRLRDPAAMKAEVLARLQAADTNKDGKLDLAEAQVAFPVLATHFAQIDKNNDGLITLDEIAAAFGPH